MRTRRWSIALCSLLLSILSIPSIPSGARAEGEGTEPPPTPAPTPTPPTPDEGNGTGAEKVPETAPPPSKHKMRHIPTASEEEPSAKHVSILWLPLQLLLPVVAFEAEIRFSDELSGAIFGGYGTAPVTVNATKEREHRKTFQIGGQLHYYVSGAFDAGGIHVGGEVLYVNVDDSSTALATTALAPGLTLGPFVGFKLVTRAGFTFDSQLGIGVLVAGAKGAEPADKDQKVTLLGNLGVGWTF